MKLILFETTFRSFISLLISFVVRAPFSHAGILVKDKLYDASESRGDVAQGKDLKEYGKRRIHVFELHDEHGHGREYVYKNIGKKYDWKGVFGWVFHSENRKKFHCFEFAYHVLVAAGLAKNKTGHIGPRDLLAVFGQPEYVGRADLYEPEDRRRR